MEEFAGKFPVKNFKAGSILLHAGVMPQNLFYLKNGYVKRYVNSLEGRELTIHIFEKGSMFPLSWALNDITPDFSLAALSEAELTLVPKDEFLKFIHANPKELMEIAKRMTMGVEGMARRVEILSFEKADRKVLSTLGYLSKHFGRRLPFTHEDLSALTGLSRERVSIEMKKLKNRGAVTYKRNLISVMKITDK